MRLIDLDPQLYRLDIRVEARTFIVGDPSKWKAGDPTEERVGPCEYYMPVDVLADAHGVMLSCPKCRSHKVLCWFAGRVADDVKPNPGRWTPAGTCFDDLTLNAPPNNPHRSVKLEGGGCGAHFYVTNGDVTLTP